MNDLIEFLEARFAEDDAALYQAYATGKGNTPDPEPWAALGWPSRVVILTPERFKAGLEAKRRIVYISENAAARIPPKGDGWEESRARQTLRHLATEYADHPDYRQEWKP